MGKLILLFFIGASLSLPARQLHTIRSGSWEADSVWYNQMIPDSVNDTILVSHHIELNSNIILSSNDYLHIALEGWLCGNVDLYMSSNANLINEGFLGLYYWEADGGTGLNDSTGYIDLGDSGAYFTGATYFYNYLGCMLVHTGPQTCLCAIDTDIEINVAGNVTEFTIAKYALYDMYIDNSFTCFFGDGQSLDTSGISITHSYLDTGTYPVMIIFYSCCATDTIYRSVHIEPQPCLCQNDTSITISVSANIASFETSIQTGNSYYYIFGDGTNTYTTSAFQTHTYPDTGFYHVTIIISNCCNTDTLHRLIYITLPCVNDFTFSLHPNPVDIGFTVKRKFCEDENVLVKLYAIDGQMVASYHFTTTAEMLDAYIPTDKLTGNCYIADFESNGVVVREKVIVIHP